MKTERYLERVGTNIREARHKAGLRQIDIEKRLGLTYRYYQTIEAGRANITLKTLLQLAELFKVDPDKLAKHHSKTARPKT